MNLLSGSYVDGEIYCKFYREVKSVVEGRIYDLANDKYFLLLASGSVARRKLLQFIS